MTKALMHAIVYWYLPTDLYKIKVLLSFYDIMFLSILTSPPPWPIMPFLYDVWNVKLQLYAKWLVRSQGWGGGNTSVKLFLFSMC